MRLDTCPACGDLGVPKFASKIDAQLVSNSTFSSRKKPELMHYALSECKSCRSLFVGTRPSQVELANAYKSAAYVAEVESALAAKSYWREIRKLGLNKVDSLLDVGCNDGAFIAVVKRAGIERVIGVEPSEEAIKKAPDEVKQLISLGTLEDVDFLEKFSMLTCFQTIEHLVDIRSFAQRARHLLNDGGTVVIICHNRNSLVNRILGQKSPIFDIEHLQILTKEGVIALLETSGFVNVDARPFSNTYPLRYWLLLAPIPRRLKDWVEKRGNAWPLSQLVRLPVGNLIVVGTNPI